MGAGALGSLVAAKLSERHAVTLVGRGEHITAIQRDGLRITGKTVCHTRDVHAVTIPDETPADVVLFTVKAYDTESAAAQLGAHAQASIFVSLQNGLGNEEILARHAPRVLGAVINQGAIFEGPGAIFHAGTGEIELGPFQGTTGDDASAVAQAFRDSDLPAEAVEAIGDRVWRKVILNAAVNPLTALLARRTGELLGDEDLENTIRQIVYESVSVAEAAGAAVDAEEILTKVWSVARATRDNKSSMFQDLERGRRTEIDAINGALVARARELGVEAPRNELMRDLIRSAEGNKSRPKP